MIRVELLQKLSGDQIAFRLVEVPYQIKQSPTTIKGVLDVYSTNFKGLFQPLKRKQELKCSNHRINRRSGMRHISPTKTFRKRMHSSMKRFNRLLNVNVNAYQDDLQKDHEFTTEEKKHAIESSLFEHIEIGENNDSITLKINYSSPNQDLQTLLKNTEYVKPILNVEKTFTKKNTLLDPSLADDLIWVGGAQQESLLAQVLGVTKVIIRTRGITPSWEITHNTFKSCRVYDQDHKNFMRCKSRHHEWIMVVNHWSSPEHDYREVRFDYVIHHSSESKEVIFSRYFVSPNKLTELYFDTYKSAVKQQTTILSLDGISEEVQDEKH